MNTEAADNRQPASAETTAFNVSDSYRNYVLGLLLVVGVFSWVDRQIFAILLESIKQEFHFSDTQLGLLGGIAFGLFYASVGLPVAWLADKFNRRNIIAIALAYFLSRPSLRHLPLAGAIHGVGAWGAGLWMLAYFMRVHDMSSGEVGTWLALIFGIFGSLGTLSGGYIADRLVRKTGDERWYTWLCAGSILITIPFTILVYTWATPIPALLFFIPAILIGHMFLGPVLAMIQNLAGVRRRAVGAAFYLFLANLVSMGAGSLIIGMISYFFNAAYGDNSLRYALLFLVLITSVWAAFHFFLASRTLREDLAHARANP